MKFFAFYLPQFHEIEENNLWWGKGFTEWTHVKAASPLFRGHCQPIHPLNGNYYNILDQKTVEWQTRLLKEYRIDGLIYYHYYFKGDKLLEKPAENLLKSNIDQKFFFCWANHSWYKASNYEKVLLKEQTYGTKENWEEHFQYLLPFFKDSRYEKKNNMPLFMIFNNDFQEKNEMMEYLHRRCCESGFDGLYVIESCDTVERSQKVIQNNTVPFMREPTASRWAYEKVRPFYSKVFLWINSQIFKGKLIPRKHIDKFDGNKLLDAVMNIKHKECAGLFFSWDNTPRHKENGFVITPIDKSHFMKYMDKNKDVEYMFINAWNEWAEGMILEPTEENGYQYLEWIKEWKEKNN